MNTLINDKRGVTSANNDECGERGSAALTAVLILALLALFTAATLARVTTEATVMGNDYANTKAFYAAQASLELMSRNFNKIFDTQLRPSTADLTRIQNSKPDIDGFDFVQTISQNGTGDSRPIEDGPFSGLISLRTPYKLDSVATYPNGSQVELTRTFFNHQIPIFQFGIFYNDDMEFHPGPRFDFGGRVHSNGHIFMMSGSDLFFRSRVTAAGQIVRTVSRNGIAQGQTGWAWDGNVWVADPSGAFRAVTRGSVIGGPDLNNSNADMPDGSANASWRSDSQVFGGNLLAAQRQLRLPLQINNSDPVELVKRGRDANDYEVTTLGRPVDDEILRGSRYANKPGIRVSLSDARAELPGGGGGVRLDGASNGLGADQDANGSRGYQPPAMNDGYRAVRVNGHRFYTGASYTDNGLPASRQTWIKVELVTVDPNTLAIVTRDITAEILSLGLTHKDPAGLNLGDDRAIIKVQRYEVPGPPIKVAASEVTTGSPSATPTPAFTSGFDPRDTGPNPTARNVYAYNSVAGYSYVANNNLYVSDKESNHEVSIGGGVSVIPFPIEIFNTREGLYNEDLATTGTPSWTSLYTNNGTNSKVPHCGVVSLIEIDMFNLGRLVRGDWDGRFAANGALPGGSLSSDDIPDNGGAGTIVYVSDRRGDRDDDGDYDMEDIYGPNDGVLQAGEDANRDGLLEADYNWESDRYTASIETDLAATRDHKYYRRGVRLINGETLIGTLNRGYSVASENGIYVLGNYNATGVTAVGDPTQPADYTGLETPCSIVSDAVTVLSRNWKDGKSFRSPFRLGVRSATTTTVRAALLMGDTMSSLKVAGVPNQGGGDQDLTGGVHNFPRFLENWGSSTPLNYCGSLINLFNSRNHNGAHKNGSNTYSPPRRNWVFDVSFLDATRLPPGTPFFQFAQMTGFRQTVRQNE
ncbi:MAG TPA: hypothetical protein VJZ26_18265 [Blastocatellia bacterium]|nr:hypothetical protein [Blastocatellia bacterium]